MRLVRYTRSETNCDLQFCWTKLLLYFILFKNDTKNLNCSAQARLALPREPAQVGDLTRITRKVVMRGLQT